jgi:hypothetical protein
MFVTQNMTILKGTLCRSNKGNSESLGIKCTMCRALRSSQIPYEIRSQPLLQRGQEA